MNQCLIIFTRYPEAGKTKTRLIPALGAEGAANLHRHMAENTLIEARKIISNIFLEVHFSGGNQQLMSDWLGNDLIYQQQCEGTIGDRMAAAFAAAINKYSQGVIIIGTDCPDLNYQIIKDGFYKLLSNDLVLGAAEDGGYYLIGLRRFIPELFQKISWSTSKVLFQTLEIAKNLNLKIDCLPTLRDIDYPEDLANLKYYKVDAKINIKTYAETLFVGWEIR